MVVQTILEDCQSYSSLNQPNFMTVTASTIQFSGCGFGRLGLPARLPQARGTWVLDSPRKTEDRDGIANCRAATKGLAGPAGPAPRAGHPAGWWPAWLARRGAASATPTADLRSFTAVGQLRGRFNLLLISVQTAIYALAFFITLEELHRTAVKHQ